MAYKAKDATKTLLRYLNLNEVQVDFIPETNNRAFIYNINDDNKCIIFIYPISHKDDNSKNFFDTRDSGAYERGVAWKYASDNNLKYFCIAVHDQVKKYANYAFSLECHENKVAETAGTINGRRSSSGTQVVIPNNFEPDKEFERIKTKFGFYIAVIHKSYLKEYLKIYDNRPYMSDFTISDEYGQFLAEENHMNNYAKKKVCFYTSLEAHKPLNRILFGAPGTGKSYTLNKEARELLGENVEDGYERVTFHPDYSYANFIGTYKPVPFVDDEGKDAITYSYVPGPFMRVYVNALKNSSTDDVRPFLLIIEEINRANVAAVFGDIFQLLDRDDDGVSDYPIQATEDIKNYLADELGGQPSDYNKILIPNNMFIWATMNSADQGVFPMDTAFRRRWDFTYIGINASEEGIQGKKVLLGKGDNQRNVEWNVLRRAINDKLSSLKINEDKLLGPYFLSKKIIPKDNPIDVKNFIAAFKNKVLMYLYDDAAKQKRSAIFADGIDTTKYSAVCEAFDEKGVFVFCKEISNRFIKKDESA